MGMTPEDIVFGRRDWRLLLEQAYQPTSDRLQQAYTRMIQRLEPLVDDLNRTLADIYKATGQITPDDVRGMPQWTRLLERMQAELTDFSVIGREEASRLAEQMLQLGVDLAPSMANAGTYQAQFEALFLRPDPEALKRLIDIAGTDAFRAAWQTFGDDAVDNFLDVMLSGMAQGLNPRAIASMISNWFGVPYSWAENMARTAQIWSYRLANHAAYAANGDLIDGWVWSASLGPRTCLSCWSQHGSFHTLDEILQDHHSGRCAPVPHIKGIPTPNLIMGPDAFRQLSEAEQRDIMGPGIYDAWKRGDVDFKDFSREYQNDTYGTMIRTATQKEMGIR